MLDCLAEAKLALRDWSMKKKCQTKAARINKKWKRLKPSKMQEHNLNTIIIKR